MAKHTGILEYGVVIEKSAYKVVFRLEDRLQHIVECTDDKSFELNQRAVVLAKFVGPNRLHPEKIYEIDEILKGHGYIDFISADFAYISMDSGSDRVFFFARNYKDSSKEPYSGGAKPKEWIKKYTRVYFETVKQENFSKAAYRAVLVRPEDQEQLQQSFLNLEMDQKREEGIILKKTPVYLFVWCRNLGRVFCPQSELERGVNRNNFKPGNWVSFRAYSQAEKEYCRWIGRQVTLEDPKLQFKLHATKKKGFEDVEVVSCSGLVTCHRGHEAIIWNEQLGRVWASPETIGWRYELQRPLTYVTFDAEPVFPHKMLQPDMGWKATRLRAFGTDQPLPALSYKECKATLLKHPAKDGWAVFTSERYHSIFATHMDYFENAGSAAGFRDALLEHIYFKVLLVENEPRHSCEFRAIFVRPWTQPHSAAANPERMDEPEDSLNDALSDGVPELQEDVLRVVKSPSVQSIPVAKRQSTPTRGKKGSISSVRGHSGGHVGCGCEVKKEERARMRTALPSPNKRPKASHETQTDKLLELKMFSKVLTNKEMLAVAKDRHRSIIQPMAELVSNRYCPDVSKAEGKTLEKVLHKKQNASTQTSKTPEKELAVQLVSDRELFDLLMDEDSELLFQLNQMLSSR